MRRGIPREQGAHQPACTLPSGVDTVSFLRFPFSRLQTWEGPPCHFHPRALSQQDRAAPRHQASYRRKDAWCISPASPRGSAHLPVAGCPVLPDHRCPPPAVPQVPSRAATNEVHLHIPSHCRGLCQHPNTPLRKPLSASPPSLPHSTWTIFLFSLPLPSPSPCIYPPSAPSPPSLLPSTRYLPPPLLATSLPPTFLPTWPSNLSSSSHLAILSQEPLPGHTPHPLATISCRNSGYGIPPLAGPARSPEGHV